MTLLCLFSAPVTDSRAENKQNSVFLGIFLDSLLHFFKLHHHGVQL